MPLLIVDGDPVTGTDNHNVEAKAVDTSSGATVPWTGTADYTYTGSMTDELSDFVRITGAAVALTTSTSSLDPGETAPPTGGHSGPAGSAFIPAPTQPPTALVPMPLTERITDDIGTGTPGSAAGSNFVLAGGDPVLLDQDPIDTCDGRGTTGNSTVTASTQSFVTASA